jgi:ribonucleoside-diphosphate reductase alpha chain
MQDIDMRNFLSETKFYEGYSRFIEDEERYETWEESVSRVIDMHKGYYDDKMSEELSSLIDEAMLAYNEQLILGAQRALQFGGEQLLRHQLKMYNCFDQNTRFLTKHGIRSFSDLNENDTVEVLTHLGNWKPAKVKSYGKQKLNKVVLTKGQNEKTVRVTANHRWLLSDGKETTDLKVGDRLFKEPSTFAEFDFDSATPNEQLYWCYGYVYGDGTVNSTHSMVRLCGHDIKYKDRFESLGFKTSSSYSLQGDFIAYTGKYKKTLPDPTIDSIEMIRAFVAGYLAADGAKNNNVGGKQYIGIQATGEESINFIRECFPIAGVHIISEKDMTGQVTNFGTRPYTINFITCDHSGSKYNSGWRVRSIEEDEEETVWCLEVEDDKSFILDGGIVTGNCLSSYADRNEFFGEFFYSLLCGAGVGFSVQKHHISKLSKIQARTKQAKTHIVEDSIEGWATALDILMSSYFVGGGKYPDYEGRKVFFDLTQIRPKGAKISGGFKAPGPDGLRLALDRIEYILQGLVINSQTQVELRPIHAYDICMHVADAVLSGGVRRAATICLFSPDDEEMLRAKTGNWFIENPQRARSNNSVVIVRDEIQKDEFMKIMESIKQFGEPGFLFVDSKDHTTNPCVEIGMFPQYEGKSGFQACNLTEINGGSCTTEDIFYRACRASAILGTLQAGYTDLKFHSETTKKIFEREALLGCSITGWMNNPDILFDKEILENGAKIVREVNEKVASLIGINPAARTTCVKPSGNASVLLGTASGIHAEHSARYIRNVQLNKESEVAQIIKKYNPEMVEESVWSANRVDYVVSFPIIPKEGSVFKDDLIGIDHLELVKKAQKHWVNAGKNPEYCVDPTVSHNVSNTIIVEDWDEVAEYVYENRGSFAGISFLPMTGDKSYNQAPNTAVITAEQMVQKYGDAAIFAAGLVVDALGAFENLWVAIDTAKGIGEDISNENSKTLLKRDWVRRFEAFARNYLNDDLGITEQCLKDSYLLHKWGKIMKNYTPIDWTKELTYKKFTDVDTLGAAACSGGSCEVDF